MMTPTRQVFGPILRSVAFALVGLSLTHCSHLMDRTKGKEKARVYLQLAADMFAQRQYGKSIEFGLEAINLDPEYAAGYNHLGIVYMETKRFAKSEESFKKALEVNPEYTEVLNNLGVLMARQERFAESVTYLEKTLKDDRYSTPENAFTNLGYAYFRLGQFAKAKTFHQRALDISPEFCLANKNLGDVYAKEKNYRKAAELFEKASTTCPLYEESQYKLGLAMMKLGQKSVAKSQFERLVERHKTGPYVERSQEVLKFLH